MGGKGTYTIYSPAKIFQVAIHFLLVRCLSNTQGKPRINATERAEHSSPRMVVLRDVFLMLRMVRPVTVATSPIVLVVRPITFIAREGVMIVVREVIVVVLFIALLPLSFRSSIETGRTRPVIARPGVALHIGKTVFPQKKIARLTTTLFLGHGAREWQSDTRSRRAARVAACRRDALATFPTPIFCLASRTQTVESVNPPLSVHSY